MPYTTSSETYSSTLRDSPTRRFGKDDKGYAYKKSSYQYSSTGNNSYGNDKPLDSSNIDQLDALLDDLKNERQIRDRDVSSSVKYRTIERGEPGGERVTQSTRIIRSTKHTGVGGGISPDEIDHHYSPSDYGTLATSSFSTQQHHDAYPSKTYEINSSSAKVIPGNIYESKINKVENIEHVSSTNRSPTSPVQLVDDLQNISDEILPLPGTKVTTTVRTYTYEIPSNVNTITRHHNVNQYNTIQKHSDTYTSGVGGVGTLQPHPHPPTAIPETVVYNTESYSTTNRTNDRPITSNQSYEIREHREVNTLRNNATTPQPHSPPHHIGLPNDTNNTTIYNISRTENIHTLPDQYPPPSSHHSPTYNGPHGSGPHGPPYGTLPPGPTTNRYYYKETSNVVNTIHGGPGGPHGPGGPGGPVGEPLIPQKNLPLSSPGYSPRPNNEYPPPPHDQSKSTIHYITKTSNYHGGPHSPPNNNYGPPSPSTQLAPFPVDGVDFPVSNGNPPQRVDDLMQSFETSEKVNATNLNTTRKREIDTSVASPSQPHIPTVNKAGKEVYYPPGHEMMVTKREEMSAGSAAGGRWAKGSGMYEYESGARSKSKTKSGGAMVPVCLPLCCAMPCSIM